MIHLKSKVWDFGKFAIGGQWNIQDGLCKAVSHLLQHMTLSYSIQEQISVPADAASSLDRHFLSRDKSVCQEPIHNRKYIFLRQQAQLNDFLLLHETLLAQNPHHSAEMMTITLTRTLTIRSQDDLIYQRELNWFESYLPIDSEATKLYVLVKAHFCYHLTRISRQSRESLCNFTLRNPC